MDNIGEVTEFAAHLIKKSEWISEPDAISWFPNTAFWTVFFFFVCAFIVVFILKQYISYLSSAYIREAREEIERKIDSRNFSSIASIIKRLCQQRWPEESISRQSLEQLPKILDRLHPYPPLSIDLCRSLITAAYQPNKSLSQQEVLTLQHWLKAFS